MIERLQAPHSSAAEGSAPGAAIAQPCKRGAASHPGIRRICRSPGTSHELTHQADFSRDSNFVALATQSSRSLLPWRLKSARRFEHFVEYGTIYVSSICQKQVANKNIQLVILIAKLRVRLHR
jgi:hypothetical protein